MEKSMNDSQIMTEDDVGHVWAKRQNNVLYLSIPDTAIFSVNSS